MRANWTRPEIADLFDLPFAEPGLKPMEAEEPMRLEAA
jgi:hypothetical protein